MSLLVCVSVRNVKWLLVYHLLRVESELPSMLCHCWLGVRVSSLSEIEWRGAGMVICLERGADDLLNMAIISSFINIQIGLNFLVLYSIEQFWLPSFICLRQSSSLKRCLLQGRGKRPFKETCQVSKRRLFAGATDNVCIMSLPLQFVWLTETQILAATNPQTKQTD